MEETHGAGSGGRNRFDIDWKPVIGFYAPKCTYVAFVKQPSNHDSAADGRSPT